MRVERAAPEEVGEVVAVLSEAAAWLRSRGIEQCPDPDPADWVESSIRRGETYLARDGGEAVGTITLRGTLSVQRRHRHARRRPVRSQRERGWPANPTQGGGTAWT